MSRIWKLCICSAIVILLLLGIVITPHQTDCTNRSGSQNVPRMIRVVMDNNYPPFAFLDGEGKLRGIIVDEWRLWERKTGVRVELHGLDWGEALRRMRAGEFDVIDTIFRTGERARVFDFSKPYTSIAVPIFFTHEISGISDANSLQDFTVAVKTGDATIEYLRAHGVERLREFRSYEEIVHSAMRHEVDIFVADEPSAHYFLYKAGGADHFRHSPSLYTGLLHRAVRKGNTPVLRLVESGFDAFSPAEKTAIEEKWSGKGELPSYLPRYLFCSGAVIFFLLLLLWVWNRALRKAVADRTVKLSREVDLSNQRAEALKKSEQRFQTIFNSVNDAIFIHDAETGAIVDVNSTMTSMYGYSHDEAVSMTVGALSSGIPPYTGSEAVARIRRAVGGEAQIFEWHARRMDGGLFWAEVNMRETIIDDKPHVLVTVRDISERKRAEDDLGRMEGLLRHSQKMEVIGRLAGCMAHDFNNILTVIIGHGKFLARKMGVEHPYLLHVDHILSSSNRAAKLINGLLTFGRRQDNNHQRVDLNHIVGDIREFLGWIIGADIEMRFDLDSRELPVMADSGQIEQVLMNMVVNARDAMLGGGILRIHTALVDVNENNAEADRTVSMRHYACLSVSDNGAGMDRNTLKRIFEPYFTTKDIGKGTGLGLAIINGIIEQHNGSVEVESEVGKGTTFMVYLPLVSSENG